MDNIWYCNACGRVDKDVTGNQSHACKSCSGGVMFKSGCPECCAVMKFHDGPLAAWFCPRCESYDGAQAARAAETQAHDPVNRPAHYTFSKIEPIDAIEAWGLGFCLGNAVKYISRARHKGNELEDLRKSRWYLDREIARLEKEIK